MAARLRALVGKEDKAYLKIYALEIFISWVLCCMAMPLEQLLEVRNLLRKINLDLKRDILDKRAENEILSSSSRAKNLLRPIEPALTRDLESAEKLLKIGRLEMAGGFFRKAEENFARFEEEGISSIERGKPHVRLTRTIILCHDGCPGKGKAIPSDANFCPYCGRKMEGNCPGCGKRISMFGNFCPQCMFDLRQAEQRRVYG
ncbi:zinc ribbon domain-containing protein [Candidatus Woesearchaeota archaeon]|nr:zinc ribbon domain-containing protein [Candidatus Woesearchaeota archaeon]